MKKNTMMVMTLGAVALLPVLILSTLLSGCPGKSSPSSPSSNGPAPTNTVTATVTATPIPGIYWQSAQFYRYENSSGNQASINLTVNGQASATVLVTINGTNFPAPVTLPYSTTNTIGGVTYASYYITSSTNSNLTYTAGGTVTLTSIAGSVTATGVVGEPGGNITVNGSGTQVSWSYPGNAYDKAYVVQVPQSGIGVTVYTSAGTTPASPLSISPSTYTAGYTYDVWTAIADGGIGYTDGAATGSSFVVFDTSETILTTYDFTSTPTLTGTPTATPTITPTSSPTVTSTSTPNPSVLTLGTFTSYQPYYLALDSQGDVYASTQNTGILKCTAAGVTSIYATGYTDTVGMAVDGSNTIYIADEGAQTANDIIPGHGGGVLGGSFSFNEPYALGVNSAASTLFISDIGANTVDAMVLGTGTTTSVLTSIDDVTGLAVDAGGDIYLSQGTYNYLGYSPSSFSSVSVYAGSGSAGSANGSLSNARFSDPLQIAMDSNGNIYVADSGNNAIRMVSTSSSTVSTLVGPAGMSPAVTQTLSGPTGVAVDGSGNVYFSAGSSIYKYIP